MDTVLHVRRQPQDNTLCMRFQQQIREWLFNHTCSIQVTQCQQISDISILNTLIIHDLGELIVSRLQVQLIIRQNVLHTFLYSKTAYTWYTFNAYSFTRLSSCSKTNNTISVCMITCDCVTCTQSVRSWFGFNSAKSLIL